jgi:hypothetical protein
MVCRHVYLDALNIEHIACSINGISVVVIYRSPRYSITLFIQHLRKLLQEMNSNSKAVFLGDFNEDLQKGTTIQSCFESYGYKQIVSSPTTEGFTLLDHVYVKNITCTANIIPTYFSYHEAVGVTFVNT